MNLTPHFSMEELTFSSTAQRLGINNTPPASVVPNLTILANGLEQVRKLMGDRPIHIDSGYRCPVLNHAVGGAVNSAHLFGWAADFICTPYGTPREIFQAIFLSPIFYDQLIIEAGAWVHISFDPLMRRQQLVASRIAGRWQYKAAA